MWNYEVKYKEADKPSSFYIEKSNKILGGDDGTEQGIIWNAMWDFFWRGWETILNLLFLVSINFVFFSVEGYVWSYWNILIQAKTTEGWNAQKYSLL